MTADPRKFTPLTSDWTNCDDESDAEERLRDTTERGDLITVEDDGGEFPAIVLNVRGTFARLTHREAAILGRAFNKAAKVAREYEARQ